eukprot:c8666_g1_i1.p2 GENE.c8666_g1_i1~~c8666_g1_i1.p2  ORF type:complete len:117 (+),score=34.31 c8666_g1_i1:787-1137(+)
MFIKSLVFFVFITLSVCLVVPSVRTQNLATTMAQCEVWVDSNRQPLAIFGQFNQEQRSSFQNCDGFCGYFLTRTQVTICFGLCQQAGLPNMIKGIKNGLDSSTHICHDVFNIQDNH